MSTRDAYDHIDTEQSVQHFAVVAVVLLSVLIAVIYLGHEFTQLILGLGRAFQV